MKALGKIITFSAGFFVGGLVTGMLLSPKSGADNRRDIANKAKKAGDWVENQGKAISREASTKMDTLKDVVPDLYKATEHLDLKEEDLM